MNTRLLFAVLISFVVSACAPFQRQEEDGPSSRIPTPQETRDAVPRVEPKSRSGNPPFYDQFGQRYYVLPAANNYKERGVASWYGKKFHGRKTSNGEIFDMYAMTAAHKTLPLPTYVEVTNLKNGKKAVVRVNDRGPFVDNRLIDLSYAAATKLDIIQDGTGLVEVRVIDPREPKRTRAQKVTPPPQTESGQIFVQVGAFSDATNATRLRHRIQSQGISPVVIAKDSSNETTIHKVRVGPISDVANLDLMVSKLKQIGVRDTVLAFE